MKNWIPVSRTQGLASRQAHADLPPGTYEREMGKEGFFGPATHFYHAHPPTNWIEFEGPLRPRAFDANELFEVSASPWDGKTVLENAATCIRVFSLNKAMDHLVRNADGDELLFVHEGHGGLFCDYGYLEFRDGDYILMPRGTMWRLEPGGPCTLLSIEATNESFMLPDRGLVGPHAVFDPAVLDTPTLNEQFKDQQNEQKWTVVVKRLGVLSRITYPFNPLDAVGWKGDLAPVRLNWRDIRPLMSNRYHLPPSAHTTFLSNRFVVCTFCPRPIESDPGALKVPFYHNNDDYDEVLFYHRGEFFSRDNIKPGMMTLHPAGFTHGPHPKAAKKGAAFARKETDEVAVMIDTRDALNISQAAQGVELVDYVYSWGGRAHPKAAE